MTKPLCIVSGIALGISVATPHIAVADPVAAFPSEAAHAEARIETPALPAADLTDARPAPMTFAQAIDDALSRKAADDTVAQAGAIPPGAPDTREPTAPADGTPAPQPAPGNDLAAAGDTPDRAPDGTAGDVPPRAAAESAGVRAAAQPIPGTLADTSPTAAADAGSAPPVAPTFGQELADGFDSRINLIGYGILQSPINSRLNPDNALAIPRYQTELDFRPDFHLNIRDFEFGVKPRFTTSWSRVQNGLAAGTDTTNATAYVNEWIARYRVTNQVLVSYGRENLQWGPSQLLSPSNPFNQNNGKNNPAIEQPGLDYGRVVVIPNASWTMSMIANTGSGRLVPSGEETIPFRRAYAAKLDYTGDKTYLSLIASKRETAAYRIGYFGGWTVSDALLAYSEGSVALSRDRGLPHPDFDVLAGAAYTLEAGPTVTVEYFHHNAGCTHSEISQCASPASIDPTRPFPRRDYVLLQYLDTKIFRKLNVTVRLIQDLNDHSTELVSFFEYEVGQNWQLYLVPSVTRGPSSSEFGSLLRYSVFAGVAFTF
ncbi:hypothetical protein LIG30_1973 [Burkholderia sp. lig30]|jgi:hypothetical protein|uniref:hypothetical protein n=1 Tax=Burkholderia sp. lig30 TaxID=1192124 RepID=UPI0004619840|nr:hypothetical protein [Burkholderia sp. lig30]KDB08990.1 hypothetical protein LIG30_1973 [Burkholderia sp. lig30]